MLAWVGVVPPSGAFVRSTSSDKPQVYFVADGERRPVDSRVLSSWGLTASSRQIARLPDADLKELPVRSALGFRPGTLVSPKNDDLARIVYAVTNDRAGATSLTRWTRGQKREVLPSSFACLGYDGRRVIDNVPAKVMDLHTNGTDVTDCNHPHGAILKHSDGRAFVLEGGVKRRIGADIVRNSWGMANDVIQPSAARDVQLNLLGGGSALGFRPGRLVRASDRKVYLITATGSDFASAERRYLDRSEDGKATQRCYGYHKDLVPLTHGNQLGLHTGPPP